MLFQKIIGKEKMNKVNSASSLRQPVLVQKKETCINNQGSGSIKLIKGLSNSLQCKLNAFDTKKFSGVNSVYFLGKVVFSKTVKHSVSGLKLPSVAVYGFSDAIGVASSFIKGVDEKHGQFCIRDLNHRIGLGILPDDYFQCCNNRMILGYMHDLSKDITSRSIAPRKERLSLGYSEKLPGKWVDFLQKNKNKVDIFSYVNSKKMASEEKSLLIKKLIIKNTNDSVDADRLNEFIQDVKLFDCKDISEAVSHLKAIDESGELSEQDLLGIFKLTQLHFFRNSSKLGIDFFRANNIGVISSWNTPADSPDKKIRVSEIYEKPYADNKRRDLNGKGGYEPITYSEIRHMNRKHKKDVEGITRLCLDGKSVELASGIDKGEWIRKDVSDFMAKTK